MTMQRRGRGQSIRGGQKHQAPANNGWEFKGDHLVPNPVRKFKDGGTKKIYFSETVESKIRGWFKQLKFLQSKTFHPEEKVDGEYVSKPLSYQEKLEAQFVLTAFWVLFAKIMEKSKGGTPIYELEVKGKAEATQWKDKILFGAGNVPKKRYAVLQYISDLDAPKFSSGEEKSEEKLEADREVVWELIKLMVDVIKGVKHDGFNLRAVSLFDHSDVPDENGTATETEDASTEGDDSANADGAPDVTVLSPEAVAAVEAAAAAAAAADAESEVAA